MYLDTGRKTICAEFFALFVAISVQLFLTTVAAAQIYYPENLCTIVIHGQITQAMATELNSALMNPNKKCKQGDVFPLNTPAGDKDALTRQAISFQLSSPGGDVDAAIRIGEAIRRVSGRTIVPGDSKCASACVLAMLGGVDRYSAGQVGLHRPYSLQLAGSPTDARKSYDVINTRIAQYLKAMNIPARLLDVMNSVPPNEVRWLSSRNDEETLRELHVTGSDPVYADQRDSFFARRLGITKVEYYGRQQRADEVCDKANAFRSLVAAETFGKCRDAVINGKR